jgi:hypothetical protein
MFIGTRVPLVNPEGFFDSNEKKMKISKAGRGRKVEHLL